MGRGLLSGVLWGSVLSVMSVWLLSQIVDLVGLVSEPSDVVVVAPDAGANDVGRNAGPAPVAPGKQSGPATDPSRQGAELGSGNSDAAPIADTATAQVPDASNVVAGQSSPQAGAAPSVSGAAEEPAATDVAGAAPATPAGESAPKPVAPLTAQPAVPVASSAPTSPDVPAQTGDTEIAESTGPSVGSEPDQPQSPVADTVPENDFSTPRVVATPEPVESEPEPVVVAEAVPEPEGSSTTEAENKVDVGAEGSAATAVVVPVVVDRTGGDDPDEGSTDSAPEAETETDAPLENAPAIELYARAFENPDGRPLMAILLLPSEDSAAAGEQAALPFPVSYVVDASKDGATDRMQRVRDAGNEVAMLAPLSDAATPKDVEIALQSYTTAVPEAVAVMDVADAVFQSGRAVATQVTDALAASGHGMVTYSRGLNSATQVAERAGVPAALVFRVFDANARDGAAIKRFLDQAAFRAGQQSGVILVGHDQPETIAALLEWALGNRASTVALAPLSAVLLAQ